MVGSKGMCPVSNYLHLSLHTANHPIMFYVRGPELLNANLHITHADVNFPFRMNPSDSSPGEKVCYYNLKPFF